MSNLPLVKLKDRFVAVLVGCCVILAAGDAIAESKPYVPYSGIIRGTVGAEPVRLEIRNDSGGAIACDAALAHWYSKPLGETDRGDTLTVPLWHDPKTGVLNILNRIGDRLPIEAVWCWRTGAASASRGRVDLPHSKGHAAPVFARQCTDRQDGRLGCFALDR